MRRVCRHPRLSVSSRCTIRDDIYAPVLDRVTLAPLHAEGVESRRSNSGNPRCERRDDEGGKVWRLAGVIDGKPLLR